MTYPQLNKSALRPNAFVWLDDPEDDVAKFAHLDGYYCNGTELVLTDNKDRHIELLHTRREL